jgi:ABC-type dipeptide/oligopeptide/nickel transport system ATPase component
MVPTSASPIPVSGSSVRETSRGGRLDDGQPVTGQHLLEVDHLSVEFRTDYGTVKAVNEVSWYLDSGETLAILGESGSGKSVSAQAIMGILDTPPGYVTGGQIRFRGDDLLTLPADQQRAVRGAQISMVFQDALSALNPVFTVGSQIAEMYRVHRGTSKKEAMGKAAELMDRVRIPSAKDRVRDYPHQFSGGMRQRVMIAMALALDPAILIADEPTTALDVTVQAQIMDLLSDLQEQTGMGIVLITHDLGVVSEVADRVNVMYAGSIVETGAIDDLFTRPGHPYTVGLMSSIPRLDQRGQRGLRLPPPLPARGAGLLGRASRAARGRARPPQRVPLRRGRARCLARWLPPRPARVPAPSRCCACPAWSSTSRSGSASSARRSSARCGRSTGSTSSCSRARPSAWSGSPAAASRRSPRCCSRSSSPRPARSSTRAATSSRWARRSCACCGARSRSSSRIPTPR